MTSLETMAVLSYLVKHLGKVEGRVRLQKTLYFLQQRGLDELSHLRFSYHHYGPYSEAVAFTLMRSVSLGAISENTESFDEQWQRFSYQPGPRIKAVSPSLRKASRRRVEEVADKTKGYHWRALELAATIHFLHDTEDLPAKAAEQRALRLKPHGKPHLKQAKRLLTDLGLTKSMTN